MPEGPDQGLKADITVVADGMVQKYAEHNPLYLCDIAPRLARHPQRDIWRLTPRGWKESRSPSPSSTDPNG